MSLPAIEEPVTWWQFTNSPPQDPEALAGQVYRTTGTIVSPEQCAALIFDEHDLILERTAEALGMDMVEFMRETQAGRIVWMEQLVGGLIAAKPLNDSIWTSIPGVQSGGRMNLGLSF